MNEGVAADVDRQRAATVKFPLRGLTSIDILVSILTGIVSLIDTTFHTDDKKAQELSAEVTIGACGTGRESCGLDPSAFHIYRVPPLVSNGVKTPQ